MDGRMDRWVDSHAEGGCIASLGVTCLPGAERDAEAGSRKAAGASCLPQALHFVSPGALSP